MQKRRLKRRHLIYYLRIYDKMSGELIGHLVNITTEGIMVISESPSRVGAEFECKMLLPAEVDGTREISFHAKSLWSRRDVNPDFYATGFQISGGDSKDFRLIKLLIDEFGFQD